MEKDRSKDPENPLLWRKALFKNNCLAGDLTKRQMTLALPSGIQNIHMSIANIPAQDNYDLRNPDDEIILNTLEASSNRHGKSA